MADVRGGGETQLKADNAGTGGSDLLTVVQGDGVSNTGLLEIVEGIFNGTTYDRVRSVQGVLASPLVKTGILASGLVGWDGLQQQIATIRLINAEPALITHDWAARNELEKIAIYLEKLLKFQLAATGEDNDLGNAESNISIGEYASYRVISAATTNADIIKIGRTALCGYSIFNTSAAFKFVKLYDIDNAPIVGTSKPDITLAIPAGGGANIEISKGVDYHFGLGITITGASPDSDTTAVAIGDVICNIFYN